MRLKRIILASRPTMWPWIALMYLVGVARFSNFSLLSLIEFILFTFPLNFYLYGLNDAYDWSSDRLNPRKDGVRGIAADDSEVSSLKKIVWIAPLLFLIVALLSRNLAHILLSIAFIMLAFMYSHEEIRLKEIPVLDCFTSAAIYSIPGLIAYSLHASIFDLPPTVFLIIIPYMAIHAVTTLLDEKVDAQAGMTTIGVVFGRTGTLLFSSLLLAASLPIFWRNKLLSSCLIRGLFLELVFLFSKKDDDHFRFALCAVLISLLVVSMIFAILNAQGL